MKSHFVLVACASFAIGCGNTSTSTPPDSTSPALDAAPPAPDASQSVSIGVGTPACQGHSDPTKQADVGPVLPDEIGDPAVARITPPSYPFKVTSVSYKLTGMESLCGTNIAGAVSVYAAPTATTPPVTPANVQRIEIGADATDERTRIVTATLPTPVVLTAGQDLFVAVEMDANTAKTVSLCLDACPITTDDQRQFWSEQPKAPFTWSTLYSFGIAVDYAIWANGKAQ